VDRDRVTVQEAARYLGISEQAIRKRVKRGTIEHDKEADGRVYVYLDSVVDSGRDDVPNPNTSTLISEMRSRIDSLERLLERAEERDRENRRIIAALTARIPELEPPQERGPEPSESPETATESPGSSTGPQDQQEPERRSWWRRLFEG
jgi:excisionase family DNA binding protein